MAIYYFLMHVPLVTEASNLEESEAFILCLCQLREDVFVHVSAEMIHSKKCVLSLAPTIPLQQFGRE